MLFTSSTGILYSQGDPKGIDIEPETSNPFAFAKSTQSLNFATLSSGVMLTFAKLCALLAETFNLTFLHPHLTALSTPLRLNTSALYSTSSFMSILLNTSSVVAICGTAFGCAKEPTSITLKPASTNILRISTFSSTVNILYSF